MNVTLCLLYESRNDYTNVEEDFEEYGLGNGKTTLLRVLSSARQSSNV